MNLPQQTAPPSLNLGVVGNCAYSALVDERGRIVWCCLPRFDGDPVFNALLDPSEAASGWSFEIEDFERSEQDYKPNTAILRTRLFDTQGQGVEITDFAPRPHVPAADADSPRQGDLGHAAAKGAGAAALRLGPPSPHTHPGQPSHPLRRHGADAAPDQ